MRREIVIRIEGEEKDKSTALTGLIKGATYTTLREALEDLDDESLKSLSKAVNGRMYNRF